MRINTWINHELISIDVDEVWLEMFAKFDALLPTEVAVAIASATSDILRECADKNAECFVTE